MSIPYLRSIFGLLVLCGTLQGVDWPAIPPEVWAIKKDTGPVARGAIILDEWVRLTEEETEVRQRIRIFGEAVKGAAALPTFNTVYKMEGRTTQPDGTTTSFGGSKDMVSGSMTVGGWTSKRKTLIPPGLTADCVVDLHYRVGSYMRNYWAEIPVLGTYPVSKKVIEVPTTTSVGWGLFGLVDLKPSQTTKGYYTQFSFGELPPIDVEPYSIPTSRERPVVIFYYVPSALRDAVGYAPKDYWNEVGDRYFRAAYEKDLNLGNSYREWSKSIREGLEGDPIVKAGKILTRLEEQIQNGSHLTFAELAALPKKAAEERMNPQDLDASVKRKRASGKGMHYLFYKLLLDEGLDPKLLKVCDRDQRAFRYGFPNIYQFTNVLIGVPAGKGGLVWFDPSTRFLPAGIIHPDYQGTHAIVFDRKVLTCKPFVLGIQGSRINRSHFEFELTLDEMETFKLNASFSGYPEFLERQKFLSLEPTEQERKLREEMETRMKAFTIRKAVVEHATNPRKNLVWFLEGVKEAEDGRRRTFSPFPGLAYPLNIPDAWPETRFDPIVLPYCFAFTAISKIKLPKGWNLGKDPDLTQSNMFGDVNWKVKTSMKEGEEWAEVVYTVEVKQGVSGASSYDEFKVFLGWIETASRRTLALDRSS